MKKKRIVIAGVVSVVGVGLLSGAYLAGVVVADPTTTPEYTQMSRELSGERAELASASEEVSDLEQQLSESQAQVEALSSTVPDNGESGDDPAVSSGAALAPRNLKLGVQVRSKECFGSAGCNVSVQIEPSYVGTQDVSEGSWDITYEIRGGEDGPIVETMTLDGGSFSFPEEQLLSTRSSGTKLRAVVIRVQARS